ncbi:MAG: chemotaxis protein [bacterium]|nr:MAG: chemotaxis protein [bacterium]
MAKKRESTGVPTWYVTFADLSTLMLTFFVLLISFSNNDIVKFREMLGSIKGAFGVSTSRLGESQPFLTGEEVFGEKTVKKKKGAPPVSAEEKEKIEKTRDLLESMADENKLGNRMSIFKRNNEILLRVDGGTFFYPGSAQVEPEGIKLLRGLAELMLKKDFTLTIEGHTDTAPISTKKFPSNWELSGIRATTVLRFMLSRNVSPDRLRAIGYADTRPVADNETKEGRAKNRRVEFVLKEIPKLSP